MTELDQLPNQFPIGTRLVIEGRGGRIRLRYLEFPDGRHVDLPLAARSGAATTAIGRAMSRRAASKKKSGRNGTRRAIAR